MRDHQFNKLFDKLAAEEQRFLNREFLAPVVSGGEVRLRIANVICTFRIEPRSFTGWGVFRPKSHSIAEHVRDASLGERSRYLELFPQLRLILCQRNEAEWLARPAHQGDSRFQIEGLVPVQAVQEAAQFDIILVRFDGTNFWFEDVDSSRSPATADWLREQLRATVDPAELHRPGLTPEQLEVYRRCYELSEQARIRRAEAEREARRLTTQGRIESALEHGGAEFVDFYEESDVYRVRYRIDNQQHVSAISKSDLTVQVAGICLDGHDRQFDLTSLVGVLREGRRGGQLYRMDR
ncbi:MAG TPA: hypothetical protein VMM56_07700 [Planctomycetaceae bacterium]|nr:hypothetical protein [Planctomycetaceae bacterium]